MKNSSSEGEESFSIAWDKVQNGFSQLDRTKIEKKFYLIIGNKSYYLWMRAICTTQDNQLKIA